MTAPPTSGSSTPRTRVRRWRWRPARRRRSSPGPSTSPRTSRCGSRCSPKGRTSTCCSPSSTTSRSTSGRSGRSPATSPRRTRPGWTGRPRAGSRRPSSTPTTRCGSGSCSATRSTPAASTPGSSTTGPRPSPGLPEEIPLPVDRPRPGTVGQRGGTLTADLPPSLARGLGRLARDANASMFMVCQAAVAALLHRTGAGDDIPLGSPVAGRTEDAARDLVGFFVNTLVLRADVSGDPTFAELLARVREADLAGLANQDLPFEAVVEALRPRRVPGRNPLFQVMVGYENQGVGDVRFPGLEQREARFGPGAAKFDLDFIFREVPDGLGLIVDYSADLFDRDTAAALADGVIALLAAVADDPGTKVAALPAELTARTVTAQPAATASGTGSGTASGTGSGDRAATGRRRCAGSSPRSWASPRSARTTTSSTSAATRCSRCGSSGASGWNPAARA
nr:condensation domain-containing protein [Actinomadura madurae]